jgi:magnesium transporter
MVDRRTRQESALGADEWVMLSVAGTAAAREHWSRLQEPVTRSRWPGRFGALARAAAPKTLDETYELLRKREGMAWIGLYRPDDTEIHSVAAEFSLHPLAVEDALKGHQRAKLERYGETLFVVLRPAWYIDAEESVEFGEVHLFVGPEFVVTIRHATKPDLATVRRRMEDNPELLARGPQAVLYAVVDEVVDGYGPVIAGLENDIDEIEDQLFGGDPAVSRRIYQLLGEVIDWATLSRLPRW